MKKQGIGGIRSVPLMVCLHLRLVGLLQFPLRGQLEFFCIKEDK